MNLPNDEIMRQITKIALEKATQEIAEQARNFAKNMPEGVTAEFALNAFADAILSTNEKVWGNQDNFHEKEM